MISKEIIAFRGENSKAFDLGNGKRALDVYIGVIHYKDNYADKSEAWKDIDLTWQGNCITKAPYELTHEGKKLTLKDKKTGRISTIELLEIGGKAIPPIPDIAWEKSKGLARVPGITQDTDLEVLVENSAVRFRRVLKSDKAPLEAKFKVTGNTSLISIKASDEDGDIPIETSLKDEILTETIKPLVSWQELVDFDEDGNPIYEERTRPLKYPVRFDPTLNLQVGASTDDTRRRLVTSYWGLTDNYVQAGYAGASNYEWGCGMRFTNITIPQGAVIDVAYLTLRSNINRAGTVVNTRISAEDVDNAVTFADDAAAFDTRWAARTTARVDWDSIAAWTSGTDYNSVEIKTVIKEIVDRGGWASGQAIVIFWEDFEDRSSHNTDCDRVAYSYDGSSTYAPKLHIEYTAPIVVTPGTISLTITEYVPSIIIGTIVTPSTLSLSITAYAPSIVLGTVITPSTLNLADTEYIPILREVTTPSTLNLAIAFYAPSITIGKTVTPATLSLSITTYAPILQEVTTPSTLSLSDTEYAPSVNIGTTLTPATLNLVITAYIPILKEVTIPPTLSLSDTQYIPVLKEVTTPTTLSLTIMEYTAVYGDGVVPPTLSLIISAYIPVLKETTTPTTLSLTLTKYVAVYGDGVVPSTLSLTITEYIPILKEVTTPTTLSLTIGEYVPVLEEVTTPTTLSLTDTEYAPILKEVIIPPTLNLIIASYISILKEVTTPTTLNLILAAYAPILREKVTAGLLSLVLTRYNAVLGTGIIPDKLGLNTVAYSPILGVDLEIIAGGVSLPVTGYAPILGEEVIPNLANLITDTYAPTVRYCEWFDLPIKVPISRLDTEAVPISQLPTSRWVRRCK